ncbi:uncharacterized protein LOC124152024 isoform X3 [Haliotis rufescens]|uniref:uncharacterized protein LOC124152024 isoform X3 n=1 Tax=Haliotis rufescens TaxID=6454 RepID=UPI00201EF4BE|nr:uncharacterized protein LOC124152024 isoform X3 [Haliotis rufescens]
MQNVVGNQVFVFNMASPTCTAITLSFCCLLSFNIPVKPTVLIHCTEEKDSSVNCPIDKYYDADARRCARCDELCHQATVRGTENKCRCLCPVDNAVTTTTTGTTQNVTRHVVAVSPKNNVTNAAGAGTTSICILGAIIILLCTTVLAVTVLWEIGTRRYYGDCCGFKASEVVEVESSNGRGKEETLRLNDRENEDSQIPN